MKERPILFSTMMVRAILNGFKTQTRRVVKSPIVLVDGGGNPFTQHWDEEEQINWRTDIECPYGQPGDQLWVKETHAYVEQSDNVPGAFWGEDHGLQGEHSGWFKTQFAADGTAIDWEPKRWWPSIHMHRWASRIQLEITNVRVERLQEISELDAICEGIYPVTKDKQLFKYCVFDESENMSSVPWQEMPKDPRIVFHSLWDSLAKPGVQWADNPWVWIIEFKRIEK